MKINELLEAQQVDEINLAGVGKAIGKGADVAGQAVGGAASGAVNAVKRFGQGLKKGWQGTSAAMTDPATGTAPADNTSSAPQSAPTTGGTAPADNTSSAPQSAPTTGVTAPAASAPASGDIGSIMQTIDKLDKPTKQQLAGELEKNITATQDPAAPAPAAATPPATPGAAPATPPASGGQSLDLDQLKKDREAKAAAGVAGQQQAQQQMATTAQANAANSQQDAAIKAAADAAKAKPAFQQTASDKLAIKQAADKGIREAKEKKTKLKKKKVVAEFKSKFLGMMI
jgi:hypothetical protein